MIIVPLGRWDEEEKGGAPNVCPGFSGAPSLL